MVLYGFKVDLGGFLGGIFQHAKAGKAPGPASGTALDWNVAVLLF